MPSIHWGDEDASWIFQGLRHISGISEWSSYNKAKLLVEQMEKEDLTLTEVGQRFGITAYGAGQWMRGFYAYKQAREESDYISEIDERSYTYFQELFSRSNASVREWLEWNEAEKKFENPINMNEFVSWIYPRSEEIDEGQDEPLGDWENRTIRTRDDIRQIAYLISEAKEYFEAFRREKDIEKAYAEAIAKKYEKEARESYDPARELFRVIGECTKALQDIPLRLIRDEECFKSLIVEITQLETAIASVRE